jgi:hypothetical protein
MSPDRDKERVGYKGGRGSRGATRTCARSTLSSKRDRDATRHLEGGRARGKVVILIEFVKFRQHAAAAFFNIINLVGLFATRFI